MFAVASPALSIVLSGTARAGTETRLAEVARGLRGRGWRVQVVSLLPRGVVADELAGEDFETADLGMTSLAQLPRAALRLRRLLRAFRPDVIHTALVHANVLGRLVGRSLGVPVVSGYQMATEIGAWRPLADRLTAPLAAGHIAVSEAAARWAVTNGHVPRSAIDVVPIGKRTGVAGNRAEIRNELAIPADAIVIGYVGRLTAIKDTLTIAAAADLVAGEPWVLFVGDGDQRPRLEGRPRTVLTGVKPDPSPYLAAMDVFALASRSEGMPGALVEAMGAGLPVVATNVGGIPEVVTDGVDGLLVPPSDPQALARAIETALGRPELGRAAAQTAQTRFSLATMIDGYERSFRRVLER
jgi:glycosyltransferase involved in cell wall biosynthesis